MRHDTFDEYSDWQRDPKLVSRISKLVMTYVPQSRLDVHAYAYKPSKGKGPVMIVDIFIFTYSKQFYAGSLVVTRKASTKPPLVEPRWNKQSSMDVKFLQNFVWNVLPAKGFIVEVN